jgi:predicted nucleic acid-binding protein
VAEGQMMPTAFLDTNIFLYVAMHDLPPEDAAKRPIASQLLSTEDYCISTQVLAEFYYNARKKGKQKLSHEEASIWVEQMLSQPCAEVDVHLVKAGMSIADRYMVSYWDGAIIAAAHQLGAKTLYSEDLNNGQTYGNVTVINPFKSISN